MYIIELYLSVIINYNISHQYICEACYKLPWFKAMLNNNTSYI